MLVLLQDPSGEAQLGSGFISRDNNDPTAQNTTLAAEADGLPYSRSLHWNVVPWWVANPAFAPRTLAAEARRAAPLLAELTAPGKALAAWLHRRRKEAALGTLSPAYAEALDVIPGWRRPSTKQADDEARWKQRLVEVCEYRAAGNDWPRHNITNDPSERLLGVWLHVQRINHHAGKLDPAKKDRLDEVFPGWRQGRAKRGANSCQADPTSA